jgi:LysM repeat protein
MGDDIEPASGASMVPLALALLAIVLGGAGLYFGLSANQQLSPLSESINEGSSSAARIDKQLSGIDTRITELSAQHNELAKTVDRLRLYGSQSEQMLKQVAGGVNSNRDELVKLAGKMRELASSGAPSPSATSATSATSAQSNTGGSGNSRSESASTGGASTYKIQSGDTFAKIANQLGVSLDALLEANTDADPRRLRIGQEINIPTN